MKTITLHQFMLLNPCYSKERLLKINGDKKDWSALDILALTDIPAKDRLWAVLRERLIDAPILHEFACRCAEEALKLVDKPDPRSIAAITAKRAWLRGEITNEELDQARAAAYDDDAAYAAAYDDDAAAAARAAASAASAASAAYDADAAYVAAYDAARAARAAASAAAYAARAYAAYVADARDKQVEMLVEMLKEEKEDA